MKEKENSTYYKKVEELLAKQNSQTALDLLKQLREDLTPNDHWLFAKSYFWEALCYKHLGNESKSKIAGKMGISLFRKLGDFVEVSKILRDQGLTYEYVEKYDKSISKLYESLDELREHDVIDAVGITFSKLGQVFYKKGDLEKAKYYSELGYNICKEGKNSFFLLTSILPLSMLYYRIGNHIAGLELVEEGEYILDKLNKVSGFVNERRLGELSLRKSLLFTGVNLFNKCFTTFKVFGKYSLSVPSERFYFTKSPEVKELITILCENGYKDKLIDYLKNSLNLDVLLLEKELNIKLS